MTGQVDVEVERKATRGKSSIEPATLVNEQPGILPLITEPGSQEQLTNFDLRQLAAVSPEAKLEKPKPISQVSPKYPWRARKEGVEGFVELAFSLDSKGKVTNIEVLDAMPTDTFERAATKALKKWKFESPDKNPGIRRMVQTFDFSLVDVERPRSRNRNCARTGRRTCSGFPSRAIVVHVNPPQEKVAVVEFN